MPTNNTSPDLGSPRAQVHGQHCQSQVVRPVSCAARAVLTAAAQRPYSRGTMEEKWPLWKLVLIALPQVSVQVLWCFIGPNSASYMRHLGLTDSLATLNNIAGPITGFFTGPIVGATSDNLTSRFGRRRPVILAGLISVCIAGTLFSTSEYFMPEGKAVYFAAPMYWVLDVTINVLQTPHRALVADLATEEQQIPMQVAFVVLMSIGNFMAFSIMKIYKCPAHV